MVLWQSQAIQHSTETEKLHFFHFLGLMVHLSSTLPESICSLSFAADPFPPRMRGASENPTPTARTSTAAPRDILPRCQIIALQGHDATHRTRLMAPGFLNEEIVQAASCYVRSDGL